MDPLSRKVRGRRTGRWLALGGLAGLLVAGAIAATQPWPSPGIVREILADGVLLGGSGLVLRTGSGAPTAAGAAATVTLLPWPTVHIASAHVVTTERRPVGAARDITVRISPANLLMGRPAIRGVTVGAMTLDGSDDAVRRLTPAVMASSLLRPLGPAPRQDAAAGDVGDALATDRATADRRLTLGIESITIAGAHGTPTFRGTLRLHQSTAGTLQLALAGTASSIDGPIGLTALLTGGGTSTRRELELALTAGAFQLELAGQVPRGDALSFEGRATVAVGRDLLQGLGLSLLSLSRDRITASGQLRMTPEGASLTAARFDGVGDNLTGAIDLRRVGARRRLQMTLDADALRLGPWDPTTSPVLAARSRLNGSASMASLWPTFDIDARLSTRQLQVGNQTILRPVVSAIAQTDRMELSILDAQWHRGALRLRATATRSDAEGIEYRASGTLDRFDADALLVTVGEMRRLSGIMSAQVALTGRGRSLAEILGTLEGRSTLMAGAGELTGIDLERSLTRAAPRLPLPPIELVAGRTLFESGQIAVQWSNGRGNLVDTGLKGEGFAVALQGGIDLGARMLDLRAQVDGTRANGDRGAAGSFSIDIVGPMSGPRITPARIGLLRRAGLD
jgi:hypothetical protein